MPYTASPLRPPLGLVALLAGLTLLYWAWHLKHPLLLALRAVETPVLLAASLSGLGLALRQQAYPRRRGWARLCALVFGAALALTLVEEARFQWQRQQVLNDAKLQPLLRVLGPHLLVGFRDFESLTPLAEQGLIGGIYLTRRNVAGKSVAEVRHEIDRLQMLRRASGLPPLFVAADQEGGKVNHLSPLLPAHPPLAGLARLPVAQRSKAAYLYGQRQAADLAALGVNLNLSPVVDLKPEGRGPLLDTHTLIAQRAIAGDTETVTQIATAYCAGLQDHGVLASLKHFPGLGRVRADTHLRAARLGGSTTRIRQDWAPFDHISRQTGSAIMLGHVQVAALDARHPASQSRTIIDGIIRQDWKYEGLILTDDLNMGAVYGQGIGPATVASLAAGADLVLITYDPDQVYRALYDATQAYRRGAIDDRRLLASRERIRRHWEAWQQRRPAAAPDRAGENTASRRGAYSPGSGRTAS